MSPIALTPDQEADYLSKHLGYPVVYKKNVRRWEQYFIIQGTARLSQEAFERLLYTPTYLGPVPYVVGKSRNSHDWAVSLLPTDDRVLSIFAQYATGEIDQTSYEATIKAFNANRVAKQMEPSPPPSPQTQPSTPTADDFAFNFLG